MPLISNRQRLGFAIALSLCLAACQQVESKPAQLAPLPQDPLIQVYFNQSQTAEYAEPYRQVTRSGDNLEQLILEAIAQAQSTVDVAVQELRLPKIARALAEKQQSGVKVRVILENSYSRPWSDLTAAEIAQLDERDRAAYDEFVQLVDKNGDRQLSPDEINQNDALIILRNSQIPWIDDTANGSKGSGLMHHKFVIVDNRTIIVTSANFTMSDVHGDLSKPDSRGNANNLLKIESYELANDFTQEFNLMWGDGTGGKPDSLFGLQKPSRPIRQLQVGNSLVTLHFSPTSPTLGWSNSSNGLIDRTLSSATQSVNLALFVFSEQRLVNTLDADRQRGVQIQALIEPSFAYRSYSEALDMMGVALANQCQYEAGDRPWQNPIQTVGIPTLPPGDKLHHKFGVVDDQIAIAGSHNWSVAANTNNDETLIVIQNPIVTAHYLREFNRLYANAQLGVPAELQRKIAAQKRDCPQITTASSTKSSSATQLVNLNTASQAELESLPGVGPKLAQQIIQSRQQGQFTTLQDLDRVPGVGPSLLSKLEGRVSW